MKRSTSMSYVDGCIGTWPKEKRCANQNQSVASCICEGSTMTECCGAVLFLPQFLRSWNLLWDPSGQRLDCGALWSPAPPRDDQVGQQWRPGLQSSLCVPRGHQATRLSNARDCERQTHSRGGRVLPAQAAGQEQHLLYQEPQQVVQRTMSGCWCLVLITSLSESMVFS